MHPRPAGSSVQSACLFVFGTVLAIHTAFAGESYHDAAFHRGPQKIPGAVFCAYYDLGGEGVAYHDNDANQGSGKLNPSDGSYLNEFRKAEAVDISYTKGLNDLESPCNKAVPPLGLLYVGWNDVGEWFNLTVEVAEAGDYTADLLYTAQRDASFSISVGPAKPQVANLVSTFDAAETIPWRQWHHWNIAPDVITLSLPKGTCTLRVRVESGGNFNLATFQFRRTGTLRTKPEITLLKPATP